MTKYAYNVNMNNAGYLQFTNDDIDDDNKLIKDKNKLDFSLNNHLKLIDDDVPHEELCLINIVEEDENLKNNILQMILYEIDIKTLIKAINS